MPITSYGTSKTEIVYGVRGKRKSGMRWLCNIEHKVSYVIVFSVLDFKMFSAFHPFLKQNTQHPPIFLFRVNLFCPRNAPGNRLCKNAAKTVEAANMLVYSMIKIMRSQKLYMLIISCAPPPLQIILDPPLHLFYYSHCIDSQEL